MIAIHLTGCPPEVAGLTPKIIRGVPGGNALSPRIVDFLLNFAAHINVQPANVKYFLNGVSAYLCTTEKEREARCETATATTEKYAQKLEACKARLDRLRQQCKGSSCIS